MRSFSSWIFALLLWGGLPAWGQVDWNRTRPDPVTPNELRVNPFTYAFPDPRFKPWWVHSSTDLYRPSPLNREQRLEILGIPASMTASALEELFKIRKDLPYPNEFSDARKAAIDRVFNRILHYVLSVNWESADESAWKSLCEKRYSYLRDLLTEMSEVPGIAWAARDFRMRDGSYVFVGHIGELLVLNNEGNLVRASSSREASPIFKDNWKLPRPIELSGLQCSYALMP